MACKNEKKRTTGRTRRRGRRRSLPRRIDASFPPPPPLELAAWSPPARARTKPPTSQSARASFHHWRKSVCPSTKKHNKGSSSGVYTDGTSLSRTTTRTRMRRRRRVVRVGKENQFLSFFLSEPQRGKKRGRERWTEERRGGRRTFLSSTSVRTARCVKRIDSSRGLKRKTFCCPCRSIMGLNSGKPTHNTTSRHELHRTRRKERKKIQRPHITRSLSVWLALLTSGIQTFECSLSPHIRHVGTDVIRAEIHVHVYLYV